MRDIPFLFFKYYNSFYMNRNSSQMSCRLPNTTYGTTLETRTIIYQSNKVLMTNFFKWWNRTDKYTYQDMDSVVVQKFITTWPTALNSDVPCPETYLKLMTSCIYAISPHMPWQDVVSTMTKVLWKEEDGEVGEISNGRFYFSITHSV